MQIQDQYPGAPDTPPARYNRRRIMVLMVVVFVVVLSFFAGRFSGNKPVYIQTGSSQGAIGTPGAERVGIPPDSLPH